MKYIVYNFNADTMWIAGGSLLGKSAILGLMITGHLTPLVGVILLVMAAAITSMAYRPHKNVYEEREVAFKEQ